MAMPPPSTARAGADLGDHWNATSTQTRGRADSRVLRAGAAALVRVIHAGPMTDHTADIAAGAEPKAGIGASIPPVLSRALALVAHAGVSIGLGLLVGGLAGAVIGTGVGLIWFWGPPLALVASAWIGDLAEWDQPRLPPIRRRPQEPAPPREETSAGNGSAS